MKQPSRLSFFYQIAFPGVTVCNQNRVNCETLNEVLSACQSTNCDCSQLEHILNSDNEAVNNARGMEEICNALPNSLNILWAIKNSSCINTSAPTPKANGKTQYNSEAEFLTNYMSVSVLTTT